MKFTENAKRDALKGTVGTIDAFLPTREIRISKSVDGGTLFLTSIMVHFGFSTQNILKIKIKVFILRVKDKYLKHDIGLNTSI